MPHFEIQLNFCGEIFFEHLYEVRLSTLFPEEQKTEIP